MIRQIDSDILKNFTFLYVEDDPLAQEGVELALAGEFKEFYIASHGEEGLDIYQQKKPDIILTDVQMPKLGGLEMAKKILAINKEQPIIVLSAYDDSHILLDAINTGITKYITKPIDLQELFKVVLEVADTIYQKHHHHQQQIQKIEHLNTIAYIDSLTNVHNRVFFEQALDKAIEYATAHQTHFALFFIDLDRFKQVNDTYGHLAGDALLQHITQEIKQVLDINTLFARISGDEFAVIVHDYTESTDLEEIAQEILKASTKPMQYHNEIIQISCSIGIARFPADGMTRKELLASADNAMYGSKKSGRDTFTLSTK